MTYTRGDFVYEFDGEEVDTVLFEDLSDEALLGLMLHGLQQGACNKILYKGKSISAVNMEDTSGAEVDDDVEISVIMTLKELKELLA